MVEITCYGSFEEMMDAMERDRRRADSRVTASQRRYRPGDIVVSDSGYGFPIFHEILDIEKLAKNGLSDYGEEYEDEAISMLDLYREPHMKNFCLTKSYSVACPYGELGDFHRSKGLGTVSREQFEEYRKNGFVIGEAGE